MGFKRYSLILWLCTLLPLISALNSTTTIKTTNDAECDSDSPCKEKWQGKYWCHTKGSTSLYNSRGWDYCSPRPRSTYRGTSCENDCQKYSSYWFCYTDFRGNWDYCGKTIK